jgi:hypothetical protein
LEYETETAWAYIGHRLPAVQPSRVSTPRLPKHDERLARTEIIARVAARKLPTQGGAGTAQSVQAWIGFMVEDTNDIYVDDLTEVVATGLKCWDWQPTASQFHKLAEPLRELRVEAARIGRLRTEIAARGPEPIALPAPPPTDHDLDALNAWGAPLGMSWDHSGTLTRIQPQRAKRPFQPLIVPTDEQLAEVARILAGKPRVERMTLTDTDYSSLGMAARG